MTIPVGAFSVLIVVALLFVVVAPIVLISLWVRDRRRGELW